MDKLTKEIKAYKQMQGELEDKYKNKWVLFHDQKLVSVYDNFENAAEEAVRLFGAGPYLIRQVGVPPVFVMPASLMYQIHRA